MGHRETRLGGEELKVFISWSGERSRALAQAIHQWLPLVLHYVEPWLSQSDIGAGDRWGIEVAKELSACSFGITCVTRENINSPWILFEAGALAKSMEEGRVVPLLLDLDFSDISGPLSQFQAKKVDKGGLLDIVSSINGNWTSPIPDDRKAQLFDALWGQLEQAVSQIENLPSSIKPNRPQAEILEELVTSVRNLDSRYREDILEGRAGRRSKFSHYRVSAMEEFMHRSLEREGSADSIIIASSILKEDYPWIYELALRFQAHASSGKVTKIRAAQKQFFEAIDILRRFPYLDEGQERALHFLMHAVDRVAETSIKASPQRRDPGRARNLARPADIEEAF